MASQKRSISFDEAVLREAEQRAGGNLSAFVNAAVGREVRALRLSELDAAYGAAWDEWAQSGDADAWESTAGDGL
jgi:hypothetical protein